VLDHPMDGYVGRPVPDHIAIGTPGQQIQTVLQEPEQGLSGVAKFGNFVEDEGDDLLHTVIEAATINSPRRAFSYRAKRDTSRAATGLSGHSNRYIFRHH